MPIIGALFLSGLLAAAQLLLFHAYTRVNVIYPSASPSRFVFSLRGERIRIGYRHPSAAQTTRLQIDVRGRTVFDRSYRNVAPSELSVLNVPGAGAPLIELRLFSGGAHCCITAVYVETNADASRTYSTVKEWRDYPPQWRRIGSDRHYESLPWPEPATTSAASGKARGPC